MACLNICCCMSLKNRQISELPPKRCFNGSIEVIGYAGSEYDTVNSI